VTAAHCQGTTARGTPCRARPVHGSRFCVRHSPDADVQAKAREGWRRGGRMRAAQLAAPTVPGIRTSDLDLSSAHGLVTYVARALAQLALLPFDVRTANAMGQLVTCQRGTLEVSDLAARITALEQQLGGPRAA